MKRDEKNIRKRIFLFVILISLAFFFLIVNGKFVSSQESFYCAEKTLDGAWCQNVPIEQVDTNYRYQATSCESTTYCSTGTCVNRVTGECLPATRATCDSSQGGVFNPAEKDEVPECQIGCCLLGSEVSLVERAKCDALGSDYNVQAEFRRDITDELTCLAMASPQEKGACTFETDTGTSCTFTTREECQNSGRDFHEGFLCTNPDLGTTCSPTKRTTCVEGKNDVFFLDSCGNLANVYDANKADDVNYWSYVPGVGGVEVNIGNGKGNINSQIYGSCDYLAGSTCGVGNARYGDFICVDLGCSASDLTKGVRREHGEAWCSEPIENFEDAKPGQLSYRLSCFNGEVQYELCDPFRNKLCNEDTETGSAQCVLNKWGDCFNQETTRDCLDTDRRDCKIVEDTGILRTNYGTEKFLINNTDESGDNQEEIKASCIPKYSPGFKFWDPEGTIATIGGDENPASICRIASVNCYVPYTKQLRGVTDFHAQPSDACIEACEEERDFGFLDVGARGNCREECTPVCLQESFGDKGHFVEIQQDWAEGWQNLCTALGDCGVTGNYLGEGSYNRWRDLFRGKKIDWRTLPNANAKK